MSSIPDPLCDAVRPVREAMEALADAGQQLRDRYSLPSVPSLGMEELEAEQRYTGIWGDRPIWTAYTLGGLSLFAAEDGMRAIGRLFAEPYDPVTVFAHMVIGRGVLEACARAHWLLECGPGLDARDRVARVLANRATDLRERRHVEAHVDPTKAAKTTAEFDRLLGNAQARGMARTGRKGKVILNVEMPGYRQLVLDLYAGSPVGDEGLPSVIYSYFSSIAHAQTFGLMQSAAREQAQVDPFGGGASVPIFTSSNGVNCCIGMITLGYLEAIEEQCRLMGWDDPEWKAVRLSSIRAVAAALPQGDEKAA